LRQSNVIQYHRVSAIILGIWLGAGVFADFAVTQNFGTVDRFLASPGSALTAAELGKIGRDRERLILRRNAGEENNYMFENWERAELLTGLILLFILAFGGRPDKIGLSLVLAMTIIVAVQHFYLSPTVTDLGRQIADLPATDPLNARFWTFHGIYSGVEILKLLTGAGLAVLLSVSKPSKTQHG
jgi:hypothetical protein